MSGTINRTVLIGNLTRDPERRDLPSGTSVCNLRIASNSRRRSAAGGEWEEKPNYFDVTVFGAQADSCARFLSKGRRVAVDGRLEWREWDTREGHHREAVEIIAESVQFLGVRGAGADGNGAEPVAVGADGADGDPDADAELSF
jgi:single-strand DNA-binding protein